MNKRFCEEEATIQKIICKKCKQKLEFINEIKDLYNSDFYISQYRCKKCKFMIEIITHEIRD